VIAKRGTYVSMQEIAAAVGLTRQAVYVHFRSRGGLLVALVRRADDRADIHARFRHALQTEDPRRRLDAFLRVWFDFVPTIHPVASSLMRARADDPEAAAAWHDRMAALRRRTLGRREAANEFADAPRTIHCFCGKACGQARLGRREGACFRAPRWIARVLSSAPGSKPRPWRDGSRCAKPGARVVR